MRIAFVVLIFPTVSETFILNQIIGLIDLGHEVDIYAGRTRDISKIHPDVDKYHLLKRTYYTRQTPNYIWRFIKAIIWFMANLKHSKFLLEWVCYRIRILLANSKIARFGKADATRTGKQMIEPKC